MKFQSHVPVNTRLLASRLGSLILLFQRSPIVQMLFPEAKVLGTAGLGTVAQWTVATIAGLGAYDTVAGATQMNELSPVVSNSNAYASPGGVSTVTDPANTVVNATVGVPLSFTVQLIGLGPAYDFTYTGGLPTGLFQSTTLNSAVSSISGTPTQAGSFPIKITAWQKQIHKPTESFSRNFTINVAPPAIIPVAISTQPSSFEIVAGNGTVVSVTATGTNPSYQWYLGNSGDESNPILNATTNSYNTPALSAETRYWVKVTNSSNSLNSNTATVSMIQVPTITLQPGMITLNSGQTATFSVSADSTIPASYQWYEGNPGNINAPIFNAATSSFTTPPLTVTSTYWVRVTNAAGFVNSSAANAIVSEVAITLPPIVTSQPSSLTLSPGNTASFTVAASGTSIAYQWYEGNSPDLSAPVPGATSNTFTTPALSATRSYWVRVSNSGGFVNSPTVTATIVIPPPTILPPKIDAQPLPVRIKPRKKATLSVQASGTALTYQWYRGLSGDLKKPIPGATAATYTTPSLRVKTPYWVRVTNTLGSKNSSTVYVIIKKK